MFHRPVSVGGVRYRLVPLQVEITDLRIGGPTPDAEPFLEVPRLVVTPVAGPAVRSARGPHARGGRAAARPRPRVPAAAATTCRASPSAGPGARCRSGGCIVAGGELELDHQRVPLDLDLPEVGGRLAQRRPGVLAGTRLLRARPRALRVRAARCRCATRDRPRPRRRERHRRVGARSPASTPTSPIAAASRFLPLAAEHRARGRGGPRHPRPPRAGQRPRPRGARPVPGDGPPGPGTPARGRAAGRHARARSTASPSRATRAR